MWQADAPRLGNLLSTERVADAVIALDLIEHPPLASGLEVLKVLPSLPRKREIVYTPNGYFAQAARYGNPWQQHLIHRRFVPAAVFVGGKSREPYQSPTTDGLWARTAAWAGSLAVGAQEIVDFSLQTPVNALVCATLVAVLLQPPSPRTIAKSALNRRAS